MKLFHARYTLRNGSRGVLHLLVDSSCSAVIRAIDIFGDQLRVCSVRRA